MIRQKAEHVLSIPQMTDLTDLSFEHANPFGMTMDDEGVKQANHNDDLKVLNEIKRNNKKRLEIQRHTYMQLLEYLREKGVKSKAFRVTESERRIFDAIKIITEANWVINSGLELRNVLIQIGIDYSSLFSQQIYQMQIEEAQD